jgi:uncharacterized membrane protein YphA (DoxX/SURF4 family)
MSNTSASIRPLAGRILVSLVFLFSGSLKVVAYSQTAATAGAMGIRLRPVSIGCAAAVKNLEDWR